MAKGKLIVIESGSDASGKATQTEKLYNRLLEEGYKVRTVSFPSYDKEHSSLVKMYLNGDFGKKAEDVDCYVASTFFTVDRYASYKTLWGSFYEEGGIILCDRYTTSNMVHQAAKLTEGEKDKFLEWLWDFEFNLYKLPKPDLVLFLNVTPKVTASLMQNRPSKIDGGNQKDIHERDEEYLRKSYENALYVANKYNWTKINCVLNEKMRTIDSIHEELLIKAKEIL